MEWKIRRKQTGKKAAVFEQYSILPSISTAEEEEEKCSTAEDDFHLAQLIFHTNWRQTQQTKRENEK